ncbi:MAG: CARDB domain-containing protein, partial [Methanoregula sp.]|nr:CARDB domain-containing protein [Methanoregula sp.]
KELSTAALPGRVLPYGSGPGDAGLFMPVNGFFVRHCVRMPLPARGFPCPQEIPAIPGNGTMRWLALCLIACICFGIAALPVSGSVDGQPAMVVNYTVSPPVLSPGGLGTITLLIQQVGKTTIEQKISSGNNNFIDFKWTDTVNIEHITLEEYGIEQLSPDYDHVGQIGSDKTLRVTFVVRAPTKSGIYFQEVWMETDAGKTRFPFPINVNTPIGTQKQAVIILQSALPETMNVGDEIPVRITLRNEGGTLAEKVSLKVGNASKVIAPKATNLYYIGTINPNEEKILDILLLSDRAAAPGLVNVPMTLQYSLIDGKTIADTESINLILNGVGELRFAQFETSPKTIFENQPFDITAQVENTGTGEARQVAATIDLPMTGTRQSDLGKIAPGDAAAAVFLMNGGAEGAYTYNVTITYVDDIGTHTKVRQHSLRVTRDLPVTILYPVLLLILIGGALGILYWYRQRKNR